MQAPFCPSFRCSAFVPLHHKTKNLPIMLLTTRQEIEIFLPTSVQESAQSILTLAEDAEETYPPSRTRTAAVQPGERTLSGGGA